jgi:hypothetical protein
MRSKSKCASGGWGWLVVRGLVIAIWDMYYEFGLCGLDLETMAGLLATSGYMRPVHYTLHVRTLHVTRRYWPGVPGMSHAPCAMRSPTPTRPTAAHKLNPAIGYWLSWREAGGNQKPKEVTSDA